MAIQSSTRVRVWTLTLAAALMFSACSQDSPTADTTTQAADAALLPDSLPLSERATEVDVFLAGAATEIESGTLSLAMNFSPRCRQREGIHSEVDPLISELDRYYSTILVDDYGFGPDATVTVLDEGPDQATAEIVSASGASSELELAFTEGAWRFDSCEGSESRSPRVSLQADGSPVVSVDSNTPSPVARTNAMIDSWAAGQSSYYPWLSMRCRAQFTSHFGPATAFTLMTANGPDGFTADDAQDAITSGEVLRALDRGRGHLLLPLLLELDEATAGAEAATADEVTVWATIDEDQAVFATKWIEEAGNLYNDQCDWLGADKALDDEFDPTIEIGPILVDLIDDAENNQLNFFDRFTARCRENENVVGPEDPQISTLSLDYANQLKQAGLEKPLITNFVSADAERVVVELGSDPTEANILAFAYEGNEWRLDSCEEAETSS